MASNLCIAHKFFSVCKEQVQWSALASSLTDQPCQEVVSFFYVCVPTCFPHFALPIHILDIWKAQEDEYASDLTVNSLGFAAGRNVSASFVNLPLLKKLRLSWRLEIKCSGLVSV